ncbi:MAG: phosphotransferase [Roseovarius sp.]
MDERAARIDAFVDRAGWAGARRVPLAGDASNRRYLRLYPATGGDSAVLMDAPPARGEDVRPFLRIARHLRRIGLSAPAILAADEAAGLLLLEDLGDDLFARVLDTCPDLENSLYCGAIDTLLALHAEPVPAACAPYDAALMSRLAGLAFDWYAAGGTGTDSSAARDRFCAVLEPLLAEHAGAEVLILRDYHAENLIWLPARAGAARVGLLDFQDAMAGHRAYDLVSLLQDARRDVPEGLESAMLARYMAAAGLRGPQAAAFQSAYHLLGAQRNLRIIGVFARLCLRDGKARYVDLIPRVWALLQRDLADPALAALRPLLAAGLPAPSPDILDRLKRQCATIPARQ